MPRRKIVLANGEYYHIFNRSIAHQPIFTELRACKRVINLINYYRFKPSLRYSHFNRLNELEKVEFMESLYKNHTPHINIYTFILMPNHYHFLVSQIKEDGISNFIKNLQISFAKYFNLRFNRKGSLFQEMFKAVRVETDEQFIHVSRYIHLNPYSTYLTENLNELESYPWSSLQSYISSSNPYSFVNPNKLLKMMGGKEKLIEFTFDQADFQRKIEGIKHLTLDR